MQGVAGIHSQKLGNALRTIDTWYPDVAELGPIAVEPYGSVTTQGKAYRKPTDKLDFYNLLDGWLLRDKVPPVEQQHFVMATLVRGGVFRRRWQGVSSCSHYIDIHLRPDPEFPAHQLMAALFAKLHRALAKAQAGTIAVSFPGYRTVPTTLGDTLRLDRATERSGPADGA